MQSAVRADSLVDTMAVCSHRARGTRAFSTHAVQLDKGMLVTGHGVRSGVNMVTCHDGVSPLMDTRPWVLAFNFDGPGKIYCPASTRYR